MIYRSHPSAFLALSLHRCFPAGQQAEVPTTFKSPRVEIADRRSSPFKRGHHKLNHGGWRATKFYFICDEKSPTKEQPPKASSSSVRILFSFVPPPLRGTGAPAVP